MDFGALPPEINSARMYAGPGPGSLIAAATAWDNVASDLETAAATYKSVVSGLTTGQWLGPSSVTMASAVAPYVAWTAGAAGQAAETASQARAAVDIYELAFAATVPPQAVTANRVQLATLTATNLFGQNTPAIAATEAQYVEMWAQDAVAMYQYAGSSAEASTLTSYTSPPQVTDAAAVSAQTAGTSTASAVTQQFSLASLLSSVPTALQSLATPASSTGSGVSGLASDLSSLGSTFSLSSLTSGLTSTEVLDMAPSYLMSTLAPLYGLSSVLGMAQTLQGLAQTAAQGAASAAADVAAGAAQAASDAGSGVLGAMGEAASLGPLSIPPAWTSVIPAAHLTTAGAAIPNGGAGALSHMPPSMLGGLPRNAAGTTAPGPRYGQIPTVMAQPPSAGYGTI